MKQLTEVIEKNLSNADIDVLQIASTLAMSRRTLYSKVKALMDSLLSNSFVITG